MSPTKNKNSICCWLFAYAIGLALIVLAILFWRGDLNNFPDSTNIIAWFKRGQHSSRQVDGDDEYKEELITVHLSPTSNGPKVRGLVIREQGLRIAQFLGIPYAQKPIVR